MNRQLYIGVLCLLTLTILSIAGCFGSGSSDNNFSVNTFVIVNGLRQIDPNTPVTGQFSLPPSEEQVDCNINPGGVTSFTGTTDSNATFGVGNAAIGSNCNWALTRGTSAKCPTANGINVFVTQPGLNFGLQCGSQVNTFLASPAKIDPTNPPATITVTGQNMYSPYGMSQVYFYDPNQTVWLQVTASSVSTDGTTLVAP